MLVWGFRAGSGSSALLRYPASASALERASRCTNRLPCDMANARLVSRAGSGSSALLRCPASASALERASRLARFVCPAIWRMLVRSLVREAEAAPSCGALHPLRPLSGPRVARIVCPATHRRIIENGECSFGLSCGKRKQRPLAVPCIRFGPWAGLASCRPLRQKFLPVSAAGSGRNFSPSRRPVLRRGR